MGKAPLDHSLDTLLDIHGQTLVVDENGDYWVKLEVRTCAVTPERPHGLSYSLTLHGPRNERLVGFDNAHAVPATKGPAARAKQRAKPAHDHKHRLRTIQPYDYQDAATLVADFWTEVDGVLRERGVLK